MQALGFCIDVCGACSAERIRAYDDKYYMKALKTSAADLGIEDADINTVFGNILTIYTLNVSLLESIEKEVANFDPNTSKLVRKISSLC